MLASPLWLCWSLTLSMALGHVGPPDRPQESELGELATQLEAYLSGELETLASLSDFRVAFETHEPGRSEEEDLNFVRLGEALLEVWSLGGTVAREYEPYLCQVLLSITRVQRSLGALEDAEALSSRMWEVFGKASEQPYQDSTVRAALLVDRAELRLQLERFAEARADLEILEGLELPPALSCTVRILEAESELLQGHVEAAARTAAETLAGLEANLDEGPGDRPDEAVLAAWRNAVWMNVEVSLGRDTPGLAVAFRSRAADRAAWNLSPPEWRDAIDLRVTKATYEAERAGVPIPGVEVEFGAEFERLAASEALSHYEDFLASIWLAEWLLDQQEPLEASEILDELEDSGQLHWPLQNERYLISRGRAAGLRKESRLPLLPALRSAFEDQLNRWRADADHAGGRGLLHFERRYQLLATLVDAEIESSGPAAGLAHALKLGELGSLARSLGQHEGLGVEDIPGILAPDESALWWLPGRGRSHAFWHDGVSVRHGLLPDASKIDLASTRLSSLLDEYLIDPATSPDVDRLMASSAELAELLFPPELRNHLTSRRSVALIGSEVLGPIPWELLPVEAPGSFGRTHAVRRVPSLQIGRWLRRKGTAPASAEAWLFMADDPGRANLARLTSNEDRLGPRAWPEGQRQERRGENATADALFDWVCKAPLMLHLIAHGIASGGPDPGTGLALAGGEELFAGTPAAAWTDAPQWTMLSVCRAGARSTRVGDDIVGPLVAQLLRAGSAHVAYGATDLFLDSSIALERQVLTELARAPEVRPAEILRRARASLYAEGSASSRIDPFLVQLVGGPAPLSVDTRLLEEGRRPKGVLRPVLGLAGVLVAAAWLLRSRSQRRSADGGSRAT